MIVPRVSLGLIVEGHGEVEAAPVLIRRIVAEHQLPLSIHCVPRRIPKSSLLKEGELESAIERLARQIGWQSPILVLIDSDEHCPSNTGPHLLHLCHSAHPKMRVGVVLAEREYETWFLYAMRSIAGQHGLASNIEPPSQAHMIQGAKEWLSEQMGSGECYTPTRHQAKFSALIDLNEARASRSFSKFEKEILRLVT